MAELLQMNYNSIKLKDEDACNFCKVVIEDMAMHCSIAQMF